MASAASAAQSQGGKLSDLDIERFLAALDLDDGPPAAPERARPLVGLLRVALDDEDVWERLTPSFYWPLCLAARDEGLDSLEASRLALRQARLVVLLLRGYPQKDAAELLGIGERTAKNDAKQVRAVLPEVSAAARRDLPPVPVPEGDRIEVRERPGRRRRRSK